MNNKFTQFLSKHPHLIVVLLALVVCIIFQISWKWLLLFYVAYAVILYFIKLPTTLGGTGYFLECALHAEKLARKMYKWSFEHQGKNVYGLMSYGLYLLRDCQYPESLDVFEYVLTITSPESVMTKYARQDFAISLWKNNRLDDAIACMEQMHKDYEYFSIDFYTTIGYFYIEAGDYEKAAEYTNLALEEDETHGPAYDNLGQIEFRKGNYEEAKELLLKALDLKDTMADSKYYLGLIYESEGDLEHALEYFIAAHKSTITGMNTVERSVIDAKYNEYMQQLDSKPTDDEEEE